MTKPALEPPAAYENLHLVARDYLERLAESLHLQLRPDHPLLTWQHVHTMALVIAHLAKASKLLDQITETKD